MKMKHFIYKLACILMFKLINNAMFSETGKQFENTNSTKLPLPKGFLIM